MRIGQIRLTKTNLYNWIHQKRNPYTVNAFIAGLWDSTFGRQYKNDIIEKLFKLGYVANVVGRDRVNLLKRYFYVDSDLVRAEPQRTPITVRNSTVNSGCCQACGLPREGLYCIPELSLTVGKFCAAQLWLLGKIMTTIAEMREGGLSERQKATRCLKLGLYSAQATEFYERMNKFYRPGSRA